MGSLISYVAGVLVALIPRGLRPWWPFDESVEFARASILSGVLQTVGSTALLFSRYMRFAEDVIASQGDFVEIAGQRGMSFLGPALFGIAGFYLQPLNFLLSYFLVEGAVRTMAAVISNQTLGTLPLAIVNWVGQGLAAWIRDSQQPPLVIDELRPGDGLHTHLVIRSCRARREWDRSVTISFRGEYYQVVRTAKISGPRPFEISLAKDRAGRPAIHVVEYHPDDVLKPGRRSDAR